MNEVAPVDQPDTVPDPGALAQYVKSATDRELLEFIALNMITPENLVAAAEEKLPEILEKFGSNPLIKTVMRFL